jgi:hypothetical protein
MRLLSLLLTAALFATALAADDAAIKNANEFLAGQEKLSPSVIGETNYKVKYMGRKFGSMTIKVAESKYGEGACYRVDVRMYVAAGPNFSRMEQTGFIAPGLRLLFSTESAEATDTPSQRGACQLTSKGYVSSEVNDDGELESFEFETAERLIVDIAEFLVTLLLPHEAGKSYEFQRWSKKRGYYPVTYTVDGETKVGDVTGVLIRESYEKIEEDDKGKDKVVQAENTFLFSKDHKLLRMTSSSEPFSIEYDDGRWSREEVEQMANPLDPVMGFWMSLRDQDVELMKLLLNEERYMEEYLKREAKDEADSEWMKELIKKKATELLAKNMIENVELDEHLKLMVDGISATWFDVTMDGEDKAKVGFSPEFKRITGDDSVMWWHLEKNVDTGMWELVYLETPEDEF